MEHFEFISKTDNKSLFNQIKLLVTCAQESYQNDLAARREHLRELLDADEKIYENEFVDKMNSRVDENIRERQESLLAMKQERTKEVEKFVASKKLQQNMQNCIQIRDELRKKDYHDTQLCQLEQMDDRLRAIARQKKDDEFWMKAQNRVAEEYDRRQQHEDSLKQALQGHQCHILAQQLAEKRRMKEMDLQHFQEMKEALRHNTETALREEKERLHAMNVAKCQDMRNALSTISKQRQLLAGEAKTFENVFHGETMRQVRLEMDKAVYKNIGLKEAVLDYLSYVKKFKTFLAEQDRKREDICEEMRHRFVCYKNHSKRAIAQRKRQAAESTHEALLKQICEEQARRLQLEAYERENKIIENRFARLEVHDKAKERDLIQKGLDMQLKEISRLKLEKQKTFESEMNRAGEEEIMCEELLKRHQSDGCDYLPPHPNWKWMDCCAKGGGDGN